LPAVPVCLWEQEGYPSFPPPAWNRVGKAFPSRSLEESLLFGDLPAAFVESEAFRKTLESYAEAYIEEEVMREASARHPGDYGRFLELAAVESGKPINLTRLSQETGIALSTIRGFYSVLEDTLVGLTVGPFTGSDRARIMKTPRFYVFDVGVRNALGRLPLDERVLATDKGGRLFEHWTACELMARIRYLGRAWHLSY
jgi:predicted AAA+ superfamily ATPase